MENIKKREIDLLHGFQETTQYKILDFSNFSNPKIEQDILDFPNFPNSKNRNTTLKFYQKARLRPHEGETPQKIAREEKNTKMNGLTD